ncbi:MAG: UDP-N-acetylmuramoyl-L-alanyl-D-glutamate--2,6-diaminopimelate ligase [Selenomonadaceae bacterium]|nr:UDP-N-acetylmuramoyl-L-alanyl-D-glutamate--2,6-diaminopimelate ligase [Selenomonadaceae bacterium]
MKTIEELALLVEGTKIVGDKKTKITSIEHDSRKVADGTMFVCFEGAHFDGHTFINQAVEEGASAILTTRTDVENLNVPDGTAILIVPDMLKSLAVIVPYFYDYPSKKMRIIGITGTNGKTTTTYMIRSILINAGYHVGLIGTIKIMIDSEMFPIHNTTPNVIDLQHIFVNMLKHHVDYVIMEVSSHALAENRVAGIEFDTAIFTNLTQDHLDFHKTMENYLQAKAKLFEAVSRSGEKNGKTAIINIDDNASAEILKHTFCNRITYGIKNNADLHAYDVDVRSDGTNFKIDGKYGNMDLNLHVTGIFNIYNVLAAVGATLAEKIEPEIISRTLEHFKSVPGRFERIYANVLFTVIVDYAHTPDGVENVIKTARQIVRNKVITVFGCGGDRDKTKRPIMGRLAAELSDIVIATSDNPRTENPTDILKDIEVGINEKIGDKIYECIEDRRNAIFRAVEIAEDGDIILILGKGHEDYQILKNRTIHFDDREVAHEAINQLIMRN